MDPWPLTMEDVRAARRRIAPYLSPTPLRRYPELETLLGRDLRVWVKHENHNPTAAFKVRNAVSALTALGEEERRAGVVAATRGNHGLGLAWAGRELGIPITVCVPVGNNPEKNDGMQALGARLVEEGADYDDAVLVAERLAAERGLHLVHSTNHRGVLAGAATIALEMLEQEPELDVIVASVGGGSQAVGALTVARELRPELAVYGVQAAAAPTLHDSWHAGRPVRRPVAPTLADGLATRGVYELTFETLRQGLRGFLTVNEDEMAAAVRLLLRATHNLAEGAGAAALAGLVKLAEELAGQRVAVILSGGNIDRVTLHRILADEPRS